MKLKEGQSMGRAKEGQSEVVKVGGVKNGELSVEGGRQRRQLSRSRRKASIWKATVGNLKSPESQVDKRKSSSRSTSRKEER